MFAIGILADSRAILNATDSDSTYRAAAQLEFDGVLKKLQKSGLCSNLKIALIYIPIGRKADLVKSFDKRLKGLTEA